MNIRWEYGIEKSFINLLPRLDVSGGAQTFEIVR